MTAATRARTRRPALFNGYWTGLDGEPRRRITRDEMRELWRLWRRHRDIREGWAKELRS